MIGLVELTGSGAEDSESRDQFLLGMTERRRRIALRSKASSHSLRQKK